MLAYCNNNPSIHVDPTGEASAALPAAGWIAAALAGFVGYLYKTVVIDTGLGDAIAGVCSDTVGSIRDTFADVKEKVETSIAKAKENSNKSEIHHIVAQKSSYYAAVESRALLARYDIDVNDPINLMPVKYNLHRRLHSWIYYNWVNNTLHAAEAAGATYAEKKSNITIAMISIRSNIDILNLIVP